MESYYHKYLKYKTKYKNLLYKRDRQKFYLIHIPKTAGTTMTNIFYKYLNMEVGRSYYKYEVTNIDRENIIKEDLLAISNHISLYHMPTYFLNNKYKNFLIQNFILFAVVRHPIDRIISEFNYIFTRIKYKKAKDIPWTVEPLNKIFDGKYSYSKDDLNKFIHNVLGDNKFKYSFDGHLIPMYMYTHEKKNGKLEKICEILKYESLNDDFNKFCKKHKLKIPENSILSNKVNMSSNKIIYRGKREDLDNKSIELIYKYYELDFKLFGYK